MGALPEVRFNIATTGREAGTKLGGEAEWLQAEWTPECCGQPMVFLAQFDSLDIPAIRFPDSALVYVLYCPKCFGVVAQMQAA